MEAQHHLTKKVKEVARFEEDNEELQHKIVEMSEGATKEVLRSTELQSALEVQQKKYLQLQDEFGNYKQNSDFQQSQLETKITSITQKWQNAESRLNELEDLEIRYKDLQEALTKLSPLLNPVAAKSASHVKPAIHDQHTEAPKDSPEDLFGYKKQQQKMKQSFLE